MPTLNWHKREEAVRAATRAPYRLLEPVAESSCGDADSENLLIQGDNLDALKALLPYYAGRVKCIAIDPPYNTRSAFQHYDDNLDVHGKTPARQTSRRPPTCRPTDWKNLRRRRVGLSPCTGASSKP